MYGVRIVTNIDLGQIFTKPFLAAYMVNLFTLNSKSTILDPCFGSGVFIDSILSETDFIPYGYEIDKDLFDSYHPQKPIKTLQNSDFLLANHTIKYDGIIMNPPYIRHEKIDTMFKYGISKEKLREAEIFSKLPKTANLYMYFIVKAIDLLKPNGELIVIFPESWLNARSGKNFRQILESKCSVAKRIHVAGRAFEKEALVEVVILKLIKAVSIVDCSPSYVRIKNNRITKRRLKKIKINTSCCVPFAQYATVRRGITTGNNSVFINPKIKSSNCSGTLCDIISSPKMINGYSTVGAKLDKLLLLEKGRDIDTTTTKYLQKCEKEMLAKYTPKTLAMKITKGEPWYYLDKIDCTGIVFGYMIRNSMRFMINNQGYLVRDNFYIISPKIEKYLLFSLLNNYYTFAQLEISGKKYGGGLLKLQKYDIDGIMLPDITIMTTKDKQNLSQLACKLSKEHDKNIIDRITDIISHYMDNDFQSIKSQYNLLKTTRLERTK
jgi:tRNA1(Val) A37 N6-methylase TrmN6